MTRVLRNITATCAAAVMLTGVASIGANAAYLGYGNGDPGNWDMWTEQSGGAKPAATPNHPGHAKAIHHASVHHHQQKPVHQS